MRKQSGFIFLLGFILYGWLEFEALILVGNIVGGVSEFYWYFPHSIHRSIPHKAIKQPCFHGLAVKAAEQKA